MKIERLVLGELQTNCYLVSDNGEAVVIDPADEPDFITEKIARANLKLTAILATHGHFDHILGASGLQILTRAPFFIHSADLPIVKYMSKSARWWLHRKILEPTPKICGFLSDKEEIKCGKTIIKVLAVPGHTPGSVCFYAPEEKVLFSGDLLFKKGVGRVDLPLSSVEDLQKSLKKIFLLPQETKVYSGHGEETTIGAEIFDKGQKMS